MKRLDYSRVVYAVLHHAAHEFAPDVTVRDAVAEITEWHIARGFSENGYHFVAKGEVIASARPLPYQGAHCLGYNDVSVGICLAADLTKRSPTQGELYAVVKAISIAEAAIGHRLSVVGHNHFDNTFCPGPDLVRMVDAIRNLDEFRF